MARPKQDAVAEEFKRRCRSHGLRVTPQRSAVYRELRKSTEHPSIETILKRVRRTLPDVSFDTVYRTVLSLSRIGIVSIVDGSGGTKRFEANMAPHHHFRCTKCHRIIDFTSGCYDAIRIPASVRRRFRVLSKRVLLEGICDSCTEK